MASDAWKGQVQFSPDGSSVTFRPRSLVDRGMGIFLILGSLALAGLSIVGVIMCTRERPVRDPMGVMALLGLGIVIVPSMFVPGLYLVTRWRRAVLDRQEVVFDKGWALGRSSRRHAHSEFLGLFTTRIDWRIGVLALIALFWKLGLIHLLQLKHRDSRSLDVLLARNTDAAAIHQLRADLTECFSFNILDWSVDGFAVRDPDPWSSALAGTPTHAGKSTAVLPASAEPAGLPPCPPELIVEVDQNLTTIQLPIWGRPLMRGICGAIVFLGIAVALGVSAAGKTVDPAGPIVLTPDVLLMLVLAMGMLFLGMVASRRRSKVTMDDNQIGFRTLKGKFLYVPWELVRYVTIAREPTTRKLALLLETDSGDYWLATYMAGPLLEWLRQAVLARAAAARDSGTSSEPGSR